MQILNEGGKTEALLSFEENKLVLNNILGSFDPKKKKEKKMTENQNWAQEAPTVEATEENVKFLEALAEKLEQNDEVLVQSAEDTETTLEVA